MAGEFASAGADAVAGAVCPGAMFAAGAVGAGKDGAGKAGIAGAVGNAVGALCPCNACGGIGCNGAGGAICPSVAMGGNVMGAGAMGGACAIGGAPNIPGIVLGKVPGGGGGIIAPQGRPAPGRPVAGRPAAGKPGTIWPMGICPKGTWFRNCMGAGGSICPGKGAVGGSMAPLQPGGFELKAFPLRWKQGCHMQEQHHESRHAKQMSKLWNKLILIGMLFRGEIAYIKAVSRHCLAMSTTGINQHSTVMMPKLESFCNLPGRPTIYKMGAGKH